MSLVLDTGPLLAALDTADPDHRTCAQLLYEATEDVVVPTLVLTSEPQTAEPCSSIGGQHSGWGARDHGVELTRLRRINSDLGSI